MCGEWRGVCMWCLTRLCTLALKPLTTRSSATTNTHKRTCGMSVHFPSLPNFHLLIANKRAQHSTAEHSITQHSADCSNTSRQSGFRVASCMQQAAPSITSNMRHMCVCLRWLLPLACLLHQHCAQGLTHLFCAQSTSVHYVQTEGRYCAPTEYKHRCVHCVFRPLTRGTSTSARHPAHAPPTEGPAWWGLFV